MNTLNKSSRQPPYGQAGVDRTGQGLCRSMRCSKRWQLMAQVTLKGTFKIDFASSPSLSAAAWCVRFSQEPADQSVVLGERVVLSCVVFNYSGIVQWTKDGLALGVGEGLRGEWGDRKIPWVGRKKGKKEKRKT